MYIVQESVDNFEKVHNTYFILVWGAVTPLLVHIPPLYLHWIVVYM